MAALFLPGLASLWVLSYSGSPYSIFSGKFFFLKDSVTFLKMIFCYTPMEGHCELCGAYTNSLASYVIESSRMQVCRNCAAFGKRERSPSQVRAIHAKLNSPAFKQRIKTYQRDIKKQKQDRLDLESGERVIDEYASVLRDLLRREQLTPELLAKKIGEKESYLSAIISGHMRPSIEAAKKIEQQYKISLF